MPYCSQCGGEYEIGVEKCSDCDWPLIDTIPPEHPDARPDAELVEVYVASGDKEAFVIRSLLESEGIICSLSSDIPHSLYPLEVDGLGAVRISVLDEDVEKAHEVISSHREASD